MSAREEARSALADYDKVKALRIAASPDRLASALRALLDEPVPVTDAEARAVTTIEAISQGTGMSREDVIRTIDSIRRPVPSEDDREALDYAIRGPVSEARLNYRPLWKLIRAIQDSVWAAGFRRSQPVTDAEVEAAVEARDQFCDDENASAWDNRVAETRAALEAARTITDPQEGITT